MTYVYECSAGVEFDYEASITDPALDKCPVCDKCKPKRLVSGGTGFVLRQGGVNWASRGYSKHG